MWNHKLRIHILAQLHPQIVWPLESFDTFQDTKRFRFQFRPLLKTDVREETSVDDAVQQDQIFASLS